MNSKFNPGNKRAILWGIAAMLLVLLLGSGVVAALLQSGYIPESSLTVVSVTIRAVATMIAAVITWSLSAQSPLRNTVISTGISTAGAAVIAMLLWQIDVQALLIGLGVGVGAVAVCVFLLSGKKNRKVGAFKKSSIVKMYKKSAR